MYQVKDNSFIRLTTLWAFVESGLGGILHAFHLPFTGIILGGFSVVIISLTAQLQKKPYAKILSATLIVLAIKVIVNPATSPFAYIAVGFQGVLGALLYSIHQKYFLVHFCFAILAMLESAAQKLLIMTLFLGKTFWQGVDGLGKNVADIFHVSSTNSLSSILIFVYLGIFFIWGCLLSVWLYYLPQQLELRKNWYQNYSYTPSDNNPIGERRKGKSFNILALLIIVLSIGSFFYKQTNVVYLALIYLLRTVSIFVIWQYSIRPIIGKYIMSWSKGHTTNNTTYDTVQQHIPTISRLAKQLFVDISSKYTGWKKWKEYLLSLIVVSLYSSNEA